MSSPATRPTVYAAWVAKCPACGASHDLPNRPAFEYSGQRIIRPDDCVLESIPCFCGERFHTNSESLILVTVATLSIQRLLNNSFAVEQRYAGTETDLGPMTSTQLIAFLNNRSLIRDTPSQVFQRLERCAAVKACTILQVLQPAATNSTIPGPFGE